MDHAFDLTGAPETIHAELISQDFLLAFAAEVGVEVDSLTFDGSGDPAVATMLWRFSTARPGIPELAKRLLPDEVRLSWAQGWAPLVGGEASGTLEVTLLGRPRASSQGKSLLRAKGAGATLSTSTATKASLPFPLAGKVESMVDRDLVGWILSVQARVLAGRHPA